MPSEVDICNIALVEMGSDFITSLTDDSKSARLCNSVYEQCRDACMRQHTWNFAKRRRTLARLTAAPDFGYTYQYQLPTNCLRFLGFYGDPEGRIRYEIEGNKLLTNEEQAQIFYIEKVTDTTLYDPLFNEYLAFTIGARIAYNLTGNQNVKAAMVKLGGDALSTAKSVNAQELNEQREERSDWLDYRRGGVDYSQAGGGA